MLSLPENCTADEVLRFIREDEARERARLLAEYPPAEWEGDAYGWPGWTDAEVWELGPATEDEPPFEPTPEDREWLATRELAEYAEAADWAEYARWAERTEAMNQLTDRDVINVTGSCG